MDPLKDYYQKINRIFEKILNERESLEKAARAIARRIVDGRAVFVFGTGGHSIMGGEEIFCRAGGFACVNAILDPSLSLINGNRRANLTERTLGYAKTVLDLYGLKEDDIIIIVNVNGINAVTIDAAEESRSRGAEVIAVTSKEFSLNVPPDTTARHPSNKNLFEISDHVIDIHVPVGDAILDIEGIPTKVSASSTLAATFALNGLMALTAKILVEDGKEPPIFRSANIPGGLEYNNKLRENYKDRVRHYF